jgi:type I restriction-modification system DNA methylase subunit
MAKLLAPEPGMTVYDPACGSVNKGDISTQNRKTKSPLNEL